MIRWTRFAHRPPRLETDLKPFEADPTPDVEDHESCVAYIGLVDRETAAAVEVPLMDDAAQIVGIARAVALLHLRAARCDRIRAA